MFSIHHAPLRFLFSLLLLANIATAQPSVDFPPGHWRAEHINDDEKVVFEVFSYASGITLFAMNESGDTDFSFTGAEWVWPDGLDWFDTDEDVDLYRVSESRVSMDFDGERLTFEKLPNSKSARLEDFVGEWVARNEADEVYKIYIYDDGTVIAMDGRDILKGRLIFDKAGVYVFFNAPETIFFSILNKQKNSFDVPSDSDSFFQFARESKAAPSRFVIDENGHPMQIDSVTLNVALHGPFAETSLEVAFTNTSGLSEEAHFELPIPSDGTITGYALEVNGAMIPAVAVPKEEARETFEALESRGVDPAIAEMSLSNQFSTEIYPIGKGMQRRIRVNYVETVKRDKNGRYRYHFPLSDLGDIAALEINLQVPNTEKLKVAAAPEKRSLKRAIRASDNNTVTHRIGNVVGNHDLSLAYSVADDLVVLNEHQGEVYFAISSNMSDALQSRPSPKSFVIAWDTSSSMAAFHEQYGKLVAALAQRYPQAPITIHRFSTQLEAPLQIAPGTSRREIQSSLENFRYDGATRLDVLNKISWEKDKTDILFSDGVGTLGFMDNRAHVDSLYTVYPEDTNINLPLLKTLSKTAEILPIESTTAKTLARAFRRATALPTVTGITDVQAFQVIRGANNSEHFTLSGRVSAEDFPITLTLIDGKQTRELHIDSSKIRVGSLAKHIWVNQQLQPLLAFPRLHEKAISALGKAHAVVTPFTSLMVLEDLEDYVEFGILPPPEIDPENEYAELRSEYEESVADDERLDELVDAWEDRVAWWHNPIPPVKQKIQHGGGYSEDGEVLEEVWEEIVVAGVRASLIQESIQIPPWSPDKPYLQVIKACSEPVECYYEQKARYRNSPAFYMDVAKYFFQNNQPDQGFKTLTNVLEILPGRIALERMVAYILLENELHDDAIEVLQFVHQIVPYEANATRDLALAWQQLGEHEEDTQAIQEAITLFYQSALSSKDDVEALPTTALLEMNRLIAQHKEEKIDTAFIDTRLIKNLPLDIRVVLSWSSNLVDLDLHVIEPSGEKVYYLKRRSTQGGLLPYDDTDGFGPEEYLLKDAKSGEYQVVAHYYGGESIEAMGEVYLNIDLFFDYAKQGEQRRSTVVRLERAKQEMLVGKFILP